MKKLLDWQSPAVTNCYDEVSLWSAPFGELLLEHIPMQADWKILDLGFGTGFPLIELSQRFGPAAQIYGVDIWQAGMARARKKMEVFEITNIQILEGSAVKIDLPDEEMDLITSNLGVNNFAEKEKVYQEILRLLKPAGSFCLTTNPVGTFATLFHLFDQSMQELGLEEERTELKKYIAHRKTKAEIIAEISTTGFQLEKEVSAQTKMRFVSAEAIWDHGLMRIGFRATWEAMIRADRQAAFFQLLVEKINEQIKKEGCFELEIPLLYLEFKK